jgi:hypothetical protein
VADDVQSLARSRPAIFLVLAAGSGLVAGRLTRPLEGADKDPRSTGIRERRPPVTDDHPRRQDDP